MPHALRRSTFLRPLQAVLLLYLLWEATAWLCPGWPSPRAVGGVLIGQFKQPAFRAALSGSARRMLIGYSLVMAVGITAGLLLRRLPLIHQVMGGLAVAVHAIPGAAWVPLAVLWFGMTERAVIFTILLGAAGIVIVNTD